jgi:HSP20 family protein
MKLIKYDNNTRDPFASLDKLFEDAFYGWNRLPQFSGSFDQDWSSTLPVNIHEDRDNYYVTAELPGVRKQDVQIELENAVLSITAERKTKQGDQESIWKVSRSVTVGEHIDAGKVKAALKDGILTVTLPRAEARKPKAITVH